jgi:DNA-binding MarR family transcriptional regulator
MQSASSYSVDDGMVPRLILWAYAPIRSPMPDTVPDVCSCTALRQAARHATQFYDAALAPSGLNVNQFSILSRLKAVGPMAIQDLAALLVTDRSTLGHVLRPLRRRRLVTLAIDPQDRRSRRVTLTASGRALLAKARPRWADAQRRFSRTMGADAARELRVILKRVATMDYGRRTRLSRLTDKTLE